MENKSKTAREWFEMLNEPERSQAIENTEKMDSIDWGSIFWLDVGDAVYSSFVFDNTPYGQGKEYWFSIYDSIKHGTYPFKGEKK